ncbi:T9SS type A sorting domain-containing protein, partial [bacterium]|nr:T9SS type A sorting domain-containing protein [bacterium]
EPSNSLALDLSTAVSFAKNSINFNENTDENLTQNKTWLLPLVEKNGNTNFKFVHEVRLKTKNPLGNWLSFVDAQTGEILWRFNTLRNETFSGNVNALVEPEVPNNQTQVFPLKNAKLTINSTSQLTTDANGNFSTTISNSGSLPITSSLQGTWIKVLNESGTNASFSGFITANSPYNLAWTSSNSTLEQTDAYYHANLAHDYVKALQNNFTGVDYQMNCNVNINDNCNAYWDGSSINFFLAGGGCNNTSRIADVIYHEYGHGITEKQYGSFSPSGAMHEGFSDYYANTIRNNPLVGLGFYSNDPNSYLRTSDNTKMYPQDLTGEVHDDGEIIAGALWELRVLIGQTATDTLFHWARYGYADNFEDYLMDLVLADDNPTLMFGGDNNINNGTPHINQIFNAFSTQHGIGLPTSIIHTPLENTTPTTTPFIVTAEVSTGVIINPVLKYSINNGQTNSVPMTLFGTNQIQATIPAQPAGTVVKYFISLAGGVNTAPADTSTGGYLFFVGTTVNSFEDFAETDNGWSLGIPGDNATSGIWVRANPVGTQTNGEQVQPEDDQTTLGTDCFVTGNGTAGGSPGANDVDGGITTLLSPVFDATSIIFPVVSYYRWYTNDQGANPGTDFFTVQISNDSGANWTTLENTQVPNHTWERFRFLISDYVTPTAFCQLKFIAKDENSGSLVEAAVDDITVFGFGGLVEIFHTPLKDTENDSVSYLVACQVNSANQLTANSPLLSYTTDGTNFTDVLLVQGAVTYFGEIPVQNYGTTVTYKITASDVVGTTTVTPDVTFYVGLDTLPPVISNLNAVLGVPSVFSAHIFDNLEVDVANTFLKFTVNGGTEQSFAVASSGNDNFYSNATISLVSGDVINYYFVAQDLAQAQNISYSDTVTIIFTSLNDASNEPQTFKLSQNFPNPFNPTTKINYELKINNKARLTIYNIIGEKVREFALEKPKGEIVWDGKDERGNTVSSGVYFYQLKTTDFTDTKKMILLK